ncbi:hypothetical protein GCM10025869_24430 [Homoserinibacter gongjuensis]|uniref:Uncharacterized protein n=1 Tax=Homoserinibacter gongjuensis TaxID=1162968 RepID=A0ABQ6JXF0_9MICO|nr:hypothetical protein GCM10025869_24430 [Homoserinibacter gongjuensis]
MRKVVVVGVEEVQPDLARVVQPLDDHAHPRGEGVGVVNVADPEVQCHRLQRRGLRDGRARPGAHVAITRRVDRDARLDERQAGLVGDDDSRDALAIRQHVAHDRVEEHVEPVGLLHEHPVGRVLEALRVERQERVVEVRGLGGRAPKAHEHLERDAAERDPPGAEVRDAVVPGVADRGEDAAGEPRALHEQRACPVAGRGDGGADARASPPATRTSVSMTGRVAV